LALIRSWCVDFGMVMMPFCSSQRSVTCAADFLCFSAIFFNTGSSSIVPPVPPSGLRLRRRCRALRNVPPQHAGNNAGAVLSDSPPGNDFRVAKQRVNVSFHEIAHADCRARPDLYISSSIFHDSRFLPVFGQWIKYKSR